MGKSRKSVSNSLNGSTYYVNKGNILLTPGKHLCCKLHSTVHCNVIAACAALLTASKRTEPLIVDEIILEWIHGRVANGLRVSRKLIMVKPKHLYDERCQEGEQDFFKATEGWLQKFMLQNGLSLRRKTTTAQQEPHRVIYG